MDYQSIEIQQYYLKTILNTSLKWKNDTSKVTEQKTYSQSSSFSQGLEMDEEINIQYFRLSDNVADLFIKNFPLQLLESFFVILGYVICEIYEELFMPTWGRTHMSVLFFPYYGFVPLDFLNKVFNEAAWNTYARMDYSFFFTMILSHWVFLVRFLMRNHEWWASKAKCYESPI